MNAAATSRSLAQKNRAASLQNVSNLGGFFFKVEFVKDMVLYLQDISFIDFSTLELVPSHIMTTTASLYNSCISYT